MEKHNSTKPLLKKDLVRFYIKERKSASDIAYINKCSVGKINYWLKNYRIKKRSISDAIYQKKNPSGDPFQVQPISTLERAYLYGLGIGLYWGEGTKSNETSVRLGNTDPLLIRAFMRFLDEIYKIRRDKLRFGLQIFSDMSKIDAVTFWERRLGISKKQFQKVIVTPSGGVGTYRHKTKHGVLTIYFNNKKLRDIICRSIENFDADLLKIKKPM